MNCYQKIIILTKMNKKFKQAVRLLAIYIIKKRGGVISGLFLLRLQQESVRKCNISKTQY